MRKHLLRLLTVVMLASLLSGCGGQNAANGSGTISIVSTIFPPYDWTRQILGDHADDAELTLLLGNGVDLHSYQATAADIVAISHCDLLIYVGGDSDAWVEDAWNAAANPHGIAVNLMDVLGDAVKAEELIEGMESDGHGEHDEHGGEHDGEAESDEHVWLSLRNAQTLCTYIADRLGETDAANAAAYKANAQTYNTELSALDAEYRAAVRDAQRETLLFADRFPFRYLLDDYGLTYYAAFPGCSAETEASFETIVFLAEKVEELQLKTIMVSETSDKSLAETVLRSTADPNRKILVWDSLQSVGVSDVSSGESYLSIMKRNLDVLKEALR